MNREDLSFKTAQRNFYSWTSKWLQTDNSEEKLAPDVLELVSMLQIFGFKVRYFDFINTGDMSLLENGEKGLSVILQCHNSGMRCNMQFPTSCRCPEKVAECATWEVSATGPNTTKSEVKETGSDALLPIPKGEQLVISTVLNHFLHTMSSFGNDHNQNNVKTPSKFVTQTPSKYHTPSARMATPTRAKTQISAVSANPIINIKSPEPPMSPARYRSLDTLTGNVDSSELPEPGILKKLTPMKESIPSLICSSPNLASSSLPSSTSSPVANAAEMKIGYSKLRVIQDLVKDVLDLFERGQEIPKLNFDISKIQGSTESLGKIEVKPSRINEKQKSSSASSPNLVSSLQVKQVKPMCRPSIRSTSSIKGPASATAVKSTVPVRRSLEAIAPKPTTQVSSAKKVVPTSSTKKYSHIKSTIPKTAAKK